MKNPWILPVVALAAGVLGGYVTGKNNSASANASSEENTPSIRTRSSLREGSTQSKGTAKRIERTLREIQGMSGSTNRMQALIDYYANLTPDQFAEEAAKLQDLPFSERMMASMILFAKWGEVDPTAAMAYTQTMGFGGMFARPTILQSWASSDPSAAASYYAAHPAEFSMMGRFGPGGGDSASSIIAREWARQNPEAALQWATSLEGNDRAQAISSTLGEVAKTDVNKAISMLATAGSEDLGAAYRVIAEAYGEQDFSRASEWIKTLPEDEQAAAYARAVSGYAKDHPDESAKLLDTLDEGRAKSEAINITFANWAKSDPNAAINHAISISDEETQREAVNPLMRQIASTNPQAALEFADKLPAGPTQDEARRTYIFANTAASPQELIPVANLIQDERMRNFSTGIAYERWMATDKSAASAALANSGLPDEMQQSILKGRPLWGRGGGRGRGGR